MKKSFKRILSLMIILIFALSIAPSKQASAATTAGKKVIVGYWHNFENGSGFIKLRDVSDDFDYVHVSFGEPTTVTSGIIQFVPYNYTDEEFISDVKYLQSKGKKVVLSIGGQNGQVQLVDDTARNNFVKSVNELMDKYGFDGLDIDFEGHSLYFDTNDKDLKNPTTPVIKNLITAIKEIKAHCGNDFVLTMAPETFFVQMGYTFYGNNGNGSDPRCGSYLPVIDALRDDITYLQVQNYNSGSIRALDGNSYAMGSADFHVAMLEMLLNGFTVANPDKQFFEPLREDQILLGIPAATYAGNGYLNEAEIQKALDYIIKGKSFGGSYKLVKPEGYPNMGGIMTWSINWDAYTNFKFSKSHRSYLDSFAPMEKPQVPTNLKATAEGTDSINVSWDSVKGATNYTLLVDGKEVKNVTSPYKHSGLEKGSTHTYKVKAINAVGESDYTAEVKATTLDKLEVPAVPSNLKAAVDKDAATITWDSVVGATSYDIYIDGKEVVKNVTSPYKLTGLKAGTYTYAVRAVNAEGESAWSESVSVKIDEVVESNDWVAWKSYKVGDVVTYSGKTYTCRQPHTSLPGWEPTNVPALWS